MIATPLISAAGIKPVGVFRDAPIREVVRTARHLKFRAVQLHGSEDADYVRTLRRNLPADCEIWTAASVGRDGLQARRGDRMLFDNGHGGSGRTFDWSRVGQHPELPRALLAGGIGAHNARQAQALGAYAIDVGSSVDERPGLKSADKIAALFDALRAPSRRRESACA